MNPNDPSSFDRQYLALLSGSGVVQLAGWSSVTLTGKDRQAFLHNFCTNDIKRLTPGASCEAFVTNVKGKIIGHGLVSCSADKLVVVGPPGQGEGVASHLDRYVIREDVTVRDTTAERSYLLLAGGNEARVFAATLAPEIGHWLRWGMLSSSCCGLIELSGESSAVSSTLTEPGAMLCDQSVFETLRIEAGTPLFGVDFGPENLPQEVGRNEQAISFTKGCYLGQETVARIDALGHVNQQLVSVRFDSSDVPLRGAPLSVAGKTVGEVTSATYSPRLRAAMALAMVRRPYNETGSRVDSPVGTGDVIALPVS